MGWEISLRDLRIDRSFSGFISFFGEEKRVDLFLTFKFGMRDLFARFENRSILLWIYFFLREIWESIDPSLDLRVEEKSRFIFNLQILNELFARFENRSILLWIWESKKRVDLFLTFKFEMSSLRENWESIESSGFIYFFDEEKRVDLFLTFKFWMNFSRDLRIDRL